MSEYIAVILPIYGKENSEKVNIYARSLAEKLVGDTREVPVKWEYYRAFVGPKGKVLIDLRDVRLWEKIWDFEQAGYPVRIECGERDIEWAKCVVSARITWEKIIIENGELESTVSRMNEEGQISLLESSQKRLIENTVACHTLEELWQAVEGGKFALYEWDKNPEFEKIIKEKYKATTRCIPFLGQFTDELLILQNPENVRVIVARNF